MPKATSNPAEIQKLDRKKQVLVLLRQGVDIRTIAEQVDLDEGYVQTLAREEMTFLSLATQEIQEHFVAMTFARSEKIMSRVLPDFDIDPPAPPDDPSQMKEWRDEVKYYRRMIGEGLKNFALLARLQKDILQVKSITEKPAGANGDINIAVNNYTMNTKMDLYQEAMDNIQRDEFGETFPEMQERYLAEGAVIQLPHDDRLSKIEKAIDNLHVPFDDPVEAAEEG